MLGSAASAFSFPEPDWGALLEEKRNMVSGTELELYAKGPASAAPYYGARLEPRSGTYFGMVAEKTDQYEGLASSYLTYFDLASGQEDIYYPANEAVNRAENIVVLIGWTADSLQDLDSRMDSIARGLENLKKYQKPMFIRFANEMNVSSLGDDPTLYVDAFRKVADLVHSTTDFAMVWSPNDLGALDRPFSYFYPGDEYVDWIGVSSYMKRYFQGNPATTENESIYFMTGSYAWSTNCIQPIVDFMEKHNIQKPLMVSEGGVANATKAGEDLSAWAMPRLENMYWYLVMKYPQVKLINYFDVHREYEAEYFNLDAKPELRQAILTAVKNGPYLTRADESASFAYVKAEQAGALSGGEIPIYAYAYVPNQTDYTVTYLLDGAVYQEASQRPYPCILRPEELPAGAHTLEARLNAGGETVKTVSLSFVKEGTLLNFGGGAGTQAPSGVKPIDITVQGQPVSFDVPPVIVEGRTLVPIRKFANAIGITDDHITYDGASGTVTLKNLGLEIVLRIDNTAASVNGNPVTLDVPAQILDGRTLVPLRFISETFHYQVSYEDRGDWVEIGLYS